MSKNQEYMKIRGEDKVWSSIKTKTGNLKNVAQTQLGQQIILDEALRVLPQVRDWIDNSSARVYRKELKEYFKNDDILLTKISETYLYLAGSIYNDYTQNNDKKMSRHKNVNTLKTRVTPELSFDLTWRFLEVIIELSQYFGVEKLLTHKDGTFNWSFRYTCNISDEILDRLSLEAAQAFYPLPMLEPPVDWSYEDEYLVGGYSHYQYEMIRANRAIDYSLYSNKIFDAINYIQSTPWRVNEHLLKQVSIDLRAPIKGDFVKTTYPDPEPCKWEILPDELKALDDKTRESLLEIRKEFREQVELYNAEVGDYESAVGKYRAVKMAVQIAEEYKGKVIYFPHSYDFRGRVYPIPVGLSPQGSDAIKALLEYANGEELTKDGEDWCWAYLASLYGDDKITFSQRIIRGKELLSADYKEADEPYQFLAHQLEMLQLVNDPKYKVKARIHLDACNSGSQFTSAITGDREGCLATNVMPTILEDGSQLRQDAYMLVAEKALALTESYINDEKDREKKSVYRLFRDLLKDKGRKICKTPVMVSNYGGTAGGRAEILWDMMRELDVERKWITKKNASLFASIIGSSITGVLSGGKAFEGYIQQMNNIISRNGKAIWWTTDDGFYVVHVKNKELKSKQVVCMLPGARRKTTIIKKQYSDKISPVKMKSAISPNYIHSLDAELLRRVALKMQRAGIKDSDWIHDSFGCHPNYVSQMLELTKIEFRKLARKSPLKKLDKELRSQADDSRATTRMLSNIRIPSLRGFNISEGDLDVVMESEWFFS
jgi:DNA-directed RNA polymerase